MQPQVQILTSYPKCDSEAYIPDQLITGPDGQKRLTYEACWGCGGTGRQKIWIKLADLLEMLADHYLFHHWQFHDHPIDMLQLNARLIWRKSKQTDDPEVAGSCFI